MIKYGFAQYSRHFNHRNALVSFWLLQNI